MTIYISGAITGKPNNNKKAFQNAYSAINELNRYRPYYAPDHIVIINPLHIGARLRSFFSKAGREPKWTDYMRACIKKLCEADCVFFLPDWTQSEGATMERYIAKKLNIPIADSMDGLKKILVEVYHNEYL